MLHALIINIFLYFSEVTDIEKNREIDLLHLKKNIYFFKEWINSGIFVVNDIIDNNGKIMQEFILHKLKNKSNWISEFSIQQ
jgi:hypothetical protein